MVCRPTGFSLTLAAHIFPDAEVKVKAFIAGVLRRGLSVIDNESENCLLSPSVSAVGTVCSLEINFCHKRGYYFFIYLYTD